MTATHLPADWSIYSDNGAVWPPGYVSALSDPRSPHTMLRHSVALSERATANRHRCAEQGIGLGNGTIPGLGKSAARSEPPAPARRKPTDQANRCKAYSFKQTYGKKSAAEVVWRHLKAKPVGTSITDAQAATLLNADIPKDPSTVRVLLRSAVDAGALECTRRGKAVSYSVGPTVPFGVEGAA